MEEEVNRVLRNAREASDQFRRPVGGRMSQAQEMELERLMRDEMGQVDPRFEALVTPGVMEWIFAAAKKGMIVVEDESSGDVEGAAMEGQVDTAVEG